MRTLIYGGTIVNEGRRYAGSIVIDDDRISNILEGEEIPRGTYDETIDATGCFVLPGIIDEHVHFREPGMTEKATEIGFDEITFLKCTFSERKVIRTDRIEKIVVSAVKQSRKAWTPSVNDMQNFKDFITKERQGLKYIAHCYDEIGRCDFFDTLSAETINDNTDVTVLIGPEGDFSVEEVELAMKNGYKPITLGKSRLRTETAGLAAVMMMNIICRK